MKNLTRTLASVFIASSVLLMTPSEAAARSEPSVDGLWVGSEIGTDSRVSVRIDTQHKSLVFVDELYVYFGTVEARETVKKNTFRTKTTVRSIVDITGNQIPAKLPAVSHGMWAQRGDKLKMCVGGPGSNIIPKSAEDVAPKVRCFKLKRL